MPNYTLYYFDGRGRAEILRMLFAAAGVQYNDKRIELNEWDKYRNDMPCMRVPVLEMDGGMKMPETMAIARFLAREHEFYPQSSMDMMSCDQITDCCNDIMNDYMKYFHWKNGHFRSGNNGQMMMSGMKSSGEFSHAFGNGGQMMSSDMKSSGVFSHAPGNNGGNNNGNNGNNGGTGFQTGNGGSNHVEPGNNGGNNNGNNGNNGGTGFQTGNGGRNPFEPGNNGGNNNGNNGNNGGTGFQTGNGGRNPFEPGNNGGNNNGNNGNNGGTGFQTGNGGRNPFENSLKKGYMNTATRLLPFMERTLCMRDGGNKFFMGDQMTLPDMMLYCCMENMMMENQSMLSQYPKLMSLYKRVASHPKICQYLQSRCKTEW